MALTRKYTWLTERTGVETTAGVITWICPEGEADGHTNALYNSVLPGAGGEYPPRAKFVKARHNAEPGFAWIVCRYITSRQPGEARLVGRIASNPIKMKIDLDGQIIEGPAGDGEHWFKVWTGPNNVPGSNFIPQGVESLVLKTAIEKGDFDLPGIRANRGAINASALPNFGNAPPGSLLFWSFDYDWKWGEALWYVDYTFLICPLSDAGGNVLSWNDILYSLKSVWVVKQVPIFAPVAGLPIDQWAATGEMAQVKELVPGFQYTRVGDENVLSAAQPEKRRAFRTADFSNLDALVVW